MLGRYREFPIYPPLQMLPGDHLERDRNTVYQIRDGVQVAERTIAPTGPDAGPWPLSEARTIDSVFFWEGPKMPGVQATVTEVFENQSTGLVRFTFSGGVQREVTSWADIETEFGGRDTDAAEAQNCAMLKAFRNSPNGTNKETMIGIPVSINFDNNQPYQFGQE